MMSRLTSSFLVIVHVSALAAPSLAATAIVVPVGSTSVPAGADVAFQVSVSSTSGFNTADILFGATGATGLSFAYSAPWNSAFANVTPISYDNGFYAKNAFVGGNHPSSVGNSLELGTITIDTTGMMLGT